MFLFGKNFVSKHYKTKFLSFYVEYHQWLTLKQKSNRKLMILFEKNFVLKIYRTKFLSCNLKGCAVLRRTLPVVEVKAKIKPITHDFVKKKFVLKLFKTKLIILQPERLGCITSNSING